MHLLYFSRLKHQKGANGRSVGSVRCACVRLAIGDWRIHRRYPLTTVLCYPSSSSMTSSVLFFAQNSTASSNLCSSAFCPSFYVSSALGHDPLPAARIEVRSFRLISPRLETTRASLGLGLDLRLFGCWVLSGTIPTVHSEHASSEAEAQRQRWRNSPAVLLLVNL